MKPGYMTITPFRLRVIRCAALLTQAQLAAMIGIDRSTITKYESGDRAISSDIERRLVLALGWNDPALQDVIASVQAWREAVTDA